MSVHQQEQVMEWEAIEQVIGASRLTLLYGPPGTGKTTAAANAAKRLGLKLQNVTLTDETPAAELRGHFIPTGPSWDWMHGPAMHSFLHGEMLVLNEIDHAGGDALDFLHALLDDSSIAAVTLPNGETITPHDDFRCVATMNELPPALRSEAVQDRLCCAIYVGTPHPDAIASLPADLQDPARNSCTTDTDPDRPLTLRRWKAYANLREAVGPEIAAQAIFAHRAVEVLDALALAASR